jgi:hypothetical protein
MQYVYVLTVTPSCTVSSPAVQLLKIPSGIIKRVQLWFDVGTDNLIRGILADGSEQVLPTNPEGFYALDGEKAAAPADYVIYDANIANGISVSCTSSHKVYNAGDNLA